MAGETEEGHSQTAARTALDAQVVQLDARVKPRRFARCTSGTNTHTQDTLNDIGTSLFLSRSNIPCSTAFELLSAVQEELDRIVSFQYCAFWKSHLGGYTTIR